MELRLLAESDFPMIHETFLDAFADYAVPMDFDADRLHRLMVRRGADLSASVGAFDDGRMVAVMATAVRKFEGVLSAYDTFTGVRPEARGQGLAGRMFDVAREELAGRGVRRFVLEVLQSNTDAIKAYTRAGFSTRRILDCYEVTAEAAPMPAVPDTVQIHAPPSIDLERWQGWRDWNPSWQNSDDSVAASVERTVHLEARVAGETIGGAILVPQARDLPQIAVAPDWRRRGVGSALLAEAMRRLESGATLRVINVDASAESDAGFFGCRATKSLPAQFEMILEFDS
jgi:ribosomal protein S18 acetylase RimI-like enzyme